MNATQPPYNLIPFRICPDYDVLFEAAKEFYVIADFDHDGRYSIVLELAPTGRVENNCYKKRT